MFLSDRDLIYAHKIGDLLVEPRPNLIGPSGIDLRLDSIEEAKLWDVPGFEEAMARQGMMQPSVVVRGFEYLKFASAYAVPLPVLTEGSSELKVYRKADSVILNPGGFFLWQTKETIGTPATNARYICFVNGKSSFARLGLVVHMTAPTIEAGWWGKITLEIGNLGPFRMVLQEDDLIAQIVVAMVSSPPEKSKTVRGIAVGQSAVTGEGNRPKLSVPPGDSPPSA